jgi:hypothetical protein
VNILAAMNRGGRRGRRVPADSDEELDEEMDEPADTAAGAGGSAGVEEAEGPPDSVGANQYTGNPRRRRSTGWRHTARGKAGGDRSEKSSSLTTKLLRSRFPSNQPYSAIVRRNIETISTALHLGQAKLLDRYAYYQEGEGATSPDDGQWG